MKRFYKDVAVAPADNGWRVTLDGRPIRTVGGRTQIVPTRTLAEAMAAEWAAQGEEIDPAGFVFRDLADYAIDVVTLNRAETIRDVLPYADTDTLCYRGEAGEALHDRQLAVWEPLLQAAERRWDVHFERISGIIHRPQPTETLQRLATVLEAQDAFTLAALKNLASLAASLTLGLSALDDDADLTALWDAANLEEDWQAELWGKDAEALDRRTRRFAGFAAAANFARLLRTEL
jgi:chaperone required for assembly of F1-ATPase